MIALAASVLMSGCAIMTTVSGVAGAAVDGLFYMFQGEEESFPISMRGSLTAAQRGLNKSGFHANVLEPVDGGYLIAFGSGSITGKMSLEKQTESLTTVDVTVRNGAFRQESIERAIIETDREQSKRVKNAEHFDFTKYKHILEKPLATSKQVGWYLPGTELDALSPKKSKWIRIKMPSGKSAFLKSGLAASVSK